MEPREITDTVVKKWAKEVMGDRRCSEKHLLAFIRAINYTQELCFEAEEERAGELPAQVLKIFNTERHPS
jgi:hypothetical protein